jgi:hypothetical protein
MALGVCWGSPWGDEKEVLKVPKLDPIFISLFKKQQVNYSLSH